MKANNFEPALSPNHQRSVAVPAVILCLTEGVVYLLAPVYVSQSVSPYFGVVSILAKTVISGFRRHFGLTDTLGLDLIPVSIRCQTK